MTPSSDGTDPFDVAWDIAKEDEDVPNWDKEVIDEDWNVPTDDCPSCGHEDPELYDSGKDGDYFETYRCSVCGANWTDWYQFQNKQIQIEDVYGRFGENFRDGVEE